MVGEKKSSCVFCNIANKLEDTVLLYEDDEICAFRDAKPTTSFHILTIPKIHIEDAKALKPSDMGLVKKMLQVTKDLLVKNNLQSTDVRFGYHWPPFRSIRHLHLHCIAPESEMGYLARFFFMKNSYWFVSPEYVESMLSSDMCNQPTQQATSREES